MLTIGDLIIPRFQGSGWPVRVSPGQIFEVSFGAPERIMKGLGFTNWGLVK